ncbi:hypothetical protein DEO72_LG8g1961 [Vigna unguiculata]|uniref:Uncharacterized protein n=1 Tax=Vigna unguiculata TaxID=3917 RepID=A0A4D6MUZ2_VIGUN|nr:hypothetical protein DEO72_LG8g1961 [Vigna unguiculata]
MGLGLKVNVGHVLGLEHDLGLGIYPSYKPCWDHIRKVTDKRFKVNLACLSLGGLDEAFETTSCLKDRELLYDVYRLARKASRTSPWNQIPQVFQKELNLEVRTMEDFGASKCNNVLGNQLGSSR